MMSKVSSLVLLIIVAMSFIASSSLSTNIAPFVSSAEITSSSWSQAFPQKEGQQLERGRTASTILLLNSTFVVLGGCAGTNDKDCLENADLPTNIEAFDGATGKSVDVVSSLGFASNQLPSAPRGWSGRQAAVIVDQQIYIMHMCTVYPSSTVPENLPADDVAFYKKTTTIQTSVASPVQFAVNVTDFPFALANASCTTNQDALVVVGGYDLEKRQFSNKMYTFDLIQQSAWEEVLEDDGTGQFPSLNVPVMHAALTSDSGCLFIASGIREDGTIEKSVRRLVLEIDRPTLMCEMPLADLPAQYLPTYSAQSGLDHTLKVFNGELMYFFSGSGKFAVLLGEKQSKATGSWEALPVTLAPPPPTSTERPGLVNCTVEDDETEGMIVAVTMGSNTTGSNLYFVRIGGSSTLTCQEYYTTTTLTSTTTSTTTTTEAPTNTSTTITVTPSTPSPPPATTSTSASATTATAPLESYRVVTFKTTSKLIFISKSSFKRAFPLLPPNRLIPANFKLIVNTSIDRDTITACDNPSLPCLWRVSNSFSCAGDTDTSNPWNFSPTNPDGETTLRVQENQFPLYICFQGANYPALSSQCSKNGQNKRTSYDVLNTLEPMTTVGDIPPNGTTASPGNNNNNNAPPAPILDQAAIIGIVVACVAFLVVVFLAWSKKLRSEDLSSAAAIVRDSRYEFLETIGEGSFGQVVRVRRRADDEIFALKYIEIPTSKEMHEALHEFEVMRQLQNFPNIITIHDLFLNFELDSSMRKSSTRRSSMMGSKRNSNLEAENAPLLLQGQQPNRRSGSKLDTGSNADSPSSNDLKPKRVLCFVMDYHPGGDLKTMIMNRYATGSDEEPIAPEALLSHIALQLLRTLDFIHERGIVHRDIKPENILIADSSRQKYGDNAPLEMFQKVVVTDFGLAKVMEINTDFLSLFGGTIAFASPEQLKYLQYFINAAKSSGDQKVELLLGDGNNNNNNNGRRRSNSTSNNNNSVYTPREKEETSNNSKQQHALKDDDNNKNDNDDNRLSTRQGSDKSMDTKRFSVNGSHSNGERSSSNDDNQQQSPSEMPSSTSEKPTTPGAPADVWSLGCVLYACMTKKLTTTRGVRALAKDLFEKYDGDDERFSESLTKELTGLKYTTAFVSLVVAMLKSDPTERITPQNALQYFRKSVKDSTYYVSSKPAQSK